MSRNPRKCRHAWQPLSFAFETQLLDGQGRVLVRQPSLTNGAVFCVCMKCRHHTYVVTHWIGYYLGDPTCKPENCQAQREVTEKTAERLKRAAKDAADEVQGAKWGR